MRSGAVVAIMLALMVVGGCQPVSSGSPEPADIEIRRLADDVWLHTSYYVYPGGTRYPSNGLIVKSGDELTLVDTAWGESSTLALLEKIAADIGAPVTRAVVTHFHGDRVAGIDILESRGVEVYAHPLTRRLTIQSGLPVADRTLSGLARPGEALAFGELELFYPGVAHTRDNLVAWLPRARLLFGGCMVRALSAKSAGNTAHGDPRSWIDVMKRVEQRYDDAVTVVPGHGEPGGIELLRHTLQLLEKTADQVG